jgi:hypothetical protein
MPAFLVAEGDAELVDEAAVVEAAEPTVELVEEPTDAAAEVAGAAVLLDAQLTASGTVTP